MKSKISCWRLVRSIAGGSPFECGWAATNMCSHCSAAPGRTQARGARHRSAAGASGRFAAQGYTRPLCARGGIGRRARLRALWGVFPRGGSSPLGRMSFGWKSGVSAPSSGGARCRAGGSRQPDGNVRSDIPRMLVLTVSYAGRPARSSCGPSELKHAPVTAPRPSPILGAAQRQPRRTMSSARPIRA